MRYELVIPEKPTQLVPSAARSSLAVRFIAYCYAEENRDFHSHGRPSIGLYLHQILKLPEIYAIAPMILRTLAEAKP